MAHERDNGLRVAQADINGLTDSLVGHIFNSTESVIPVNDEFGRGNLNVHEVIGHGQGGATLPYPVFIVERGSGRLDVEGSGVPPIAYREAYATDTDGDSLLTQPGTLDIALIEDRMLKIMSVPLPDTNQRSDGDLLRGRNDQAVALKLPESVIQEYALQPMESVRSYGLIPVNPDDAASWTVRAVALFAGFYLRVESDRPKFVRGMVLLEKAP